MKNTKGIGVVAVIIIIAVVVIVGIIAYKSGKHADKASIAPEEGQATGASPANKSPVASGSGKNQPQTNAQCSNQFLVVDSATGIKIPNPSFSIDGKKFAGTSSFLAYLKTLSDGQYRTDVSASGYNPQTGVRVIKPENEGLIIELAPTSVPSNGPAYIKNKVRVFGYVVSACDHNPVSGVSISLSNYGTAMTSAKGLYTFDVDPKIAGESCDGLTASFRKTGYVDSIITRFGSAVLALNPSGPSLYQHNIMLKQGNGSETTDETHALCQ